MPLCPSDQPTSYSLSPYLGSWTKKEASHLLRRTTFGPTQAQISTAVADGIFLTVENILQIPTIEDPLTWETLEAVAPFGTTWVNSVLPVDPVQSDDTIIARRNSMRSWFAKRINSEQLNAPSIAEKMCFFWHNHFGTRMENEHRISYDYYTLIKSFALGNFRELIKQMTIDCNMLKFLNNDTNTKNSPNENFARELLELYTIGKGPQIGPGDYSNYTEDDVAAAARILTGWKVREYFSTTTHPYSEYYAPHHDVDDKQLSYHFNNAIVSNNDQNEFIDYINIIFQQTETANFICRKLYRYFVNFEITTQVESQVITQMAQTLISNNWEIRPVLKELLRSEHFYDVKLIGSNIKSPYEFIFSMLNPTFSIPNFGILGDHVVWRSLYYRCSNEDQNYLYPPSVSGWPVYYQEPSFMRLWLNADTLADRFDAISDLTTGNGIGSTYNNTTYKIKINALGFLDSLSVPADGIQVINEICDLFLIKTVEQTKKDHLLDILTNGLPAFEWTIQYNEYILNPGDPNYADPVRQRVELVLKELFMYPEFQTV